MADIEELKKRLDRAVEIENTLDRRMWVLGVITEALAPHEITPILVGGGAVEFYTFGNYTTYDIDVAMPTARMVDEVLGVLGFGKSGRYWINAYVHWKSKEDGRWAKRMLSIHSDSLDWDYLESFAKQEQVGEALSELRRNLSEKNAKD